MRSKRFVQEWISTFFSTISFYIIFFSKIRQAWLWWESKSIWTFGLLFVWKQPFIAPFIQLDSRFPTPPNRVRFLRDGPHFRDAAAGPGPWGCVASGSPTRPLRGAGRRRSAWGWSRTWWYLVGPKRCVYVCVCKISIDVHYFIVCTMESSTMEFDFLSALFPARFTVAVLCT